MVRLLWFSTRMAFRRRPVLMVSGLHEKSVKNANYFTEK